MAAEWGEAHRREALRRTYEIAAELVAERPKGAAYLVCEAAGYALTEKQWRGELADVDGPALDAARIDREVRRVRGLAEGRLVRSVVWRGESGEEYATREEARADKSHGGAPLTRITRIRKATP